MDVVFHNAGLAGLWGPWETYHGINTLGTQHVIAGCRRHGVGRLVYTSSPSVTFDGHHQCGIDESAPYPTRWLCHYPHSKALAEQAVLAAAGADLAACALRPHLIWGPRDTHLIPQLVARAKSGKLRRVGAGKNLIDMIYAENAAEAHLQAADALAPGSPPSGRAYFLSQGEPVNCWEWINEILSVAGVPPIMRSVPFLAAWAIGAALEARHAALRLSGEPRMTRFLAAQLAKHHYYDISAARRDFGYAPRVSKADGMARLAEWFETERRLSLRERSGV
jgi:nucleoside-diphosphate-sugar epimerase